MKTTGLSSGSKYYVTFYGMKKSMTDSFLATTENLLVLVLHVSRTLMMVLVVVRTRTVLSFLVEATAFKGR
jgi:hypothetical protein